MDKEVEILNHLKCVIDPELMVNIVDLGLIYELHFLAEQNKIEVEMTLTSQGCPMGDVIQQNVEEILKANYPDFTITITLVWNPPWSPDMMSEAAKSSLGN